MLNRCASCFNVATNQRSLEIDDVNLDIKPKSIHVGQATQNLRNQGDRSRTEDQMTDGPTNRYSDEPL